MNNSLNQALGAAVAQYQAGIPRVENQDDRLTRYIFSPLYQFPCQWTAELKVPVGVVFPVPQIKRWYSHQDVPPEMGSVAADRGPDQRGNPQKFIIEPPGPSVRTAITQYAPSGAVEIESLRGIAPDVYQSAGLMDLFAFAQSGQPLTRREYHEKIREAESRVIEDEEIAELRTNICRTLSASIETAAIFATNKLNEAVGEVRQTGRAWDEADRNYITFLGMGISALDQARVKFAPVELPAMPVAKKK